MIFLVAIFQKMQTGFTDSYVLSLCTDMGTEFKLFNYSSTFSINFQKQALLVGQQGYCISFTDEEL